MPTEIDSYLQQYKNIHDGGAWIYVSFTSTLEKVEPALAFIPSSASQNSVAQLLDHLTTWRNRALLLLKSEDPITSNPANDWKSNDEVSSKGWESIISQHKLSISLFIEHLKTLSVDDLDKEYFDIDYKSTKTKRWLIQGQIQHDLYHLGQLAIIINQTK